MRKMSVKVGGTLVEVVDQAVKFTNLDEDPANVKYGKPEDKKPTETFLLKPGESAVKLLPPGEYDVGVFHVVSLKQVLEELKAPQSIKAFVAAVTEENPEFDERVCEGHFTTIVISE